MQTQAPCRHLMIMQTLDLNIMQTLGMIRHDHTETLGIIIMQTLGMIM